MDLLRFIIHFKFIFDFPLFKKCIQDMTEIQVKVTVKDIDDNDPIFTQTNITTGKLIARQDIKVRILRKLL